LQKHELCFNNFPDQREGCPEFREQRPDSALPLVLVTCMDMVYTRQYKNVFIKECKLHHKRKVELARQRIEKIGSQLVNKLQTLVR
jgi:hypothetical protein